MDLQRLFLIIKINKTLTDLLDEVDLYVLRHVVRGVDSVWGEPCNAQRREGACSTLVCPVANGRSTKFGNKSVSHPGLKPASSRTCAAIIALEEALERNYGTLAEWIKSDYAKRGRDITMDAARYGKINLIHHLHRNRMIAPITPKIDKKHPSDPIMSAAAESGEVELLEYLRLAGYICPPSAAVAAAWHGRSQVIGWMVINGIDIVPATVSLYAAKAGHLNVLMRLRQLKLLDLQAFDGAAEAGHGEIIRWLVSIDKLPKDRAIYFAARGGQRDCILRLLEIGAQWHDGVTEAAAEHSLEMLEWVLDRGAPWSKYACVKAIRKGYADVTKVADRRGLEYDTAYCNALKSTLAK